MACSRTWSRWARRLAMIGLHVASAAVVGTGCHSAEPFSEQSGIANAFSYPGLQAPIESVTHSRPADPVSPLLAASLTSSQASPVKPAGAVEPPAPAPLPLISPADVVPQVAATPSETVDLEVALRLAGVGNPTINLARERIREALAELLGARSLLLPSVNIGGNYHLHNGFLQASPGIIRYVNSRSLYLGFGARTLAAESVAFPGIRLFAHLGDAVYEPLAARQQVAARRSDAQAVQNEVLLEVAVAYLELVGAEARLAVLRQGEIDVAEVVRLTRVYAEKGQGRAGDANRAEAQADLLSQEVRRAEEEIAVASARLSQLLSLDPSIRLRTPGGAVEPYRLIAEEADTESLVAEAVQSRPEIFARSSEILEAQTRVRQERVRPWVPLLSVGYSGGLFGGGSNLVSPAFGSLTGRSDFDVLAVWTLQNLGAGNRARARTAEAVMGQAVADYDGAINRIRREVAESQAASRAAARQIEAAKAALAAADEGFRLETDRIRQGLGLPIETLDSFDQLLEARQDLVRRLVEYDIAQFRLFVAVGSTPGGSTAPMALLPDADAAPMRP